VKRLLTIAILFTAMFGCKSAETDVQSLAAAGGIAGKWKLVAEEQGFVGQSTWATVKEDSAYNIIFRNDGLLLNSKGLPACCGPTSLTINGSFFEVKPTGQLAPNPECALVNCANCPLWDIQITGNEMTVTRCKDLKKKYLRI